MAPITAKREALAFPLRLLRLYVLLLAIFPVSRLATIEISDVAPQLLEPLCHITHKGSPYMAIGTLYENTSRFFLNTVRSYDRWIFTRPPEEHVGNLRQNRTPHYKLAKDYARKSANLPSKNTRANSTRTTRSPSPTTPKPARWNVSTSSWLQPRSGPTAMME